MKTKYDIPVELKELDELLEHHNEAIIWQQNIRSKWLILNLFTQIVLTGIFIFYLRDVINVLISLAFLVPALLLLYRSNTMKYSIQPNNIKFEWGLLGTKKILIPFTDITAINLVKYDGSKNSTIFFGTKSKYKIRKLNFDLNEPRPHITFENVKNGNKVYELLNLMWTRSKNSTH